MCDLFSLDKDKIIRFSSIAYEGYATGVLIPFQSL
jgi:hypothetical protein